MYPPEFPPRVGRINIEQLRDRGVIENFRRSVEAKLNADACSNEETLFYSGVLRTLNWVLLRDSELPLFRHVV